MTEKMIARYFAKRKVIEVLKDKGCRHPECRKCQRCGYCVGKNDANS